VCVQERLRARPPAAAVPCRAKPCRAGLRRTGSCWHWRGAGRCAAVSPGCGCCAGDAPCSLSHARAPGCRGSPCPVQLWTGGLWPGRLETGQGSRWHSRLALSQRLMTRCVIKEGVVDALAGPRSCSTCHHGGAQQQSQQDPQQDHAGHPDMANRGRDGAPITWAPITHLFGGAAGGKTPPPLCPQCLGLGVLVQHPGLNPPRFWSWGQRGAQGWGGLSPPGLMSPFLLQSMEMVPVPTNSYGNFYEGDCYVLLSVGWPGDQGWVAGVQGGMSLVRVAWGHGDSSSADWCPTDTQDWEQLQLQHPLLAGQGVKPGRAGGGRHLHHPDGRPPGHGGCAAPRGPGQRERDLPCLLQAGTYVRWTPLGKCSHSG